MTPGYCSDSVPSVRNWNGLMTIPISIFSSLRNRVRNNGSSIDSTGSNPFIRSASFSKTPSTASSCYLPMGFTASARFSNSTRCRRLPFLPVGLSGKIRHFPGADLTVSKQTPPSIRRDTLDFALNEALTNLYVGLCRYARGERLSGLQLVEQHAFSQLLSVLHLLEPEVVYYPDRYGNERRAEQRFPQAQERFADVLQGYDRVPQSALALLEWLEQLHPVNQAMAAEIRRLAAECRSKQNQ